MIVFFMDRDLNITGHASTSLPGGLRIVEDTTTEDVDSGVNSFTCEVSYNDQTRRDLESAIQTGRFILKGGGTAFAGAENSYDSLYQIVETEFDSDSQEISLYAEDAGLDLINKIVPEMTLTSKTLREMLRAFVPSDWTLNLNGCPTGKKSNTWDGENTATERINSIANLFDCEVHYSFVIERFQITGKVINLTPKRGTQTASVQLRVNQEITRIAKKESIANLATAFEVTGGTPEKSDKPITLKNYTYSYTDPETGDVYKVDKPTGQIRNVSAMKRWSSALDKDGLIVKTFSFDTTNKAVLAGQARAELQKSCLPEVNYECDFVDLGGAQIGDRVIIIDEEGELYLEARLLKVETSVTQGTQQAVIGEYLIRRSGVSDAVRSFAEEFIQKVKDGADGITISITSSGGNVFHNTPIATTLRATIFVGTQAITDQTALEQAYGEEAELKWYDSAGSLAGTGFSLPVSSVNDIAKYKVRLEI